MRRCELCDANMDVMGTRHRCVGGKPAGEKLLTRLDKERGVVSQPATKPIEPLGRLAPRPPMARAAQAQPACACRADEVLSAIDNLRLAFEKFAATLSQDRPHTDA
jgi:hypothetical protein